MAFSSNLVKKKENVELTDPSHVIILRFFVF